ncbi:MAG: DeoR/GlpR family DNA-binding transcription regulator [Treponema sp.]|jgi:DeoR/GlpR family transcriptional regulator of sugar metabolism|nr:DeoR/GlpR family DNA-binding transcription regulator [Treponema sp.]
MNNRQSKILEAIARQQRIEVTDLAKRMNVSPVTIRKDLDQLEQRGLIRREHGYAYIETGSNDGTQLVYNYEIKHRIAQAAAASVEENETVMIGCGSCCVILAEELAYTKKDVTIITNSAFIANYINKSPHGKIILLGGYYQRNSQVLVGPIAHKNAELFSPNKFFISANGFSETFGFTGHDYFRAQTVQELAKQARQVVMLFDSEKFSNSGVVKVASVENINVMYTDAGIPPEKEAHLLQNNILVHKVPASKAGVQA